MSKFPREDGWEQLACMKAVGSISWVRSGSDLPGVETRPRSLGGKSAEGFIRSFCLPATPARAGIPYLKLFINAALFRVFAGFDLNHFPPPALLMFNHQRLHLTPKNDLRMKDQRWRQNKTTRSCSVFLRKRREGWTKREERKNASQAQSERS